MAGLILISVMIILLGIFNALMDISSIDHFKKPFFNKNESWDNKNNYIVFGYEIPVFLHTKIIRLLLRTILVFVTDGWHLFQFLFHTTWQITLSYMLYDKINLTNNMILDITILFIIIKTLFSGVFQISYTYIKNNI
jgi:hypothetical protein